MENKDFTEIDRSVYDNLNRWNNLINKKKMEDKWIEFEGIPNYQFKNPVIISDNNDDLSNITITVNYDDYMVTE